MLLWCPNFMGGPLIWAMPKFKKFVMIDEQFGLGPKYEEKYTLLLIFVWRLYRFIFRHTVTE